MILWAKSSSLTQPPLSLTDRCDARRESAPAQRGTRVCMRDAGGRQLSAARASRARNVEQAPCHRKRQSPARGADARFGLNAIARPSRALTSAFVTGDGRSRLAQRRRRDYRIGPFVRVRPISERRRGSPGRPPQARLAPRQTHPGMSIRERVRGAMRERLSNIWVKAIASPRMRVKSILSIVL